MRHAVVDLQGVRGPALTIEWDVNAAKVRWPFDTPFENFRLLDPLSRFVAIAVEALGGPFDPDSAIVLATVHGCLWTDQRFEASRHDELRPGLFPYTLPSAPLAAVAIRHRIGGPSLCLAGGPDQAHEEAQALLTAGEAPAAIICTGDVCGPDDVHIEATYLTR